MPRQDRTTTTRPRPTHRGHGRRGRPPRFVEEFAADARRRRGHAPHRRPGARLPHDDPRAVLVVRRPAGSARCELGVGVDGHPAARRLRVRQAPHRRRASAATTSAPRPTSGAAGSPANGSTSTGSATSSAAGSPSSSSRPHRHRRRGRRGPRAPASTAATTCSGCTATTARCSRSGRPSRPPATSDDAPGTETTMTEPHDRRPDRRPPHRHLRRRRRGGPRRRRRLVHRRAAARSSRSSGESGSGKSMTAMTAMGIAPDGAVAGSVSIDGSATSSVLGADERTSGGPRPQRRR